MPHTNNKETERIEEIANEFTKWHSAETTFAYGVPNDKTIADWWIEKLHQELQKARHDWLREVIVKLEGMKKIVDREKFNHYYLAMNNPPLQEYEQNGYNNALQAIIDRYQSELDQPIV